MQILNGRHKDKAEQPDWPSTIGTSKGRNCRLIAAKTASGYPT
jgi:hypothetical protein